MTLSMISAIMSLQRLDGVWSVGCVISQIRSHTYLVVSTFISG